MRIAYVITRSALGGAQAHVLELIREFASGNKLAVIAGEPGDFVEEAACSGAEAFILPELVRSPMPPKDMIAAARLRGLIRSFRPDLIHAHTYKAGVIARVVAHWMRIPSIYTAHGWQFAPGTSVVNKCTAYPGEWFAARLGDAIITVSQFDYDLAVRWRVASRNQIVLVRNGIRDCPERARPAATGTFNVVMVARFARQKDQLSLIRCLPALGKNARLWFVGEGPTMARMQAEAQTLGVTRQVVFWGHHNDVSSILAAAHVFVLASHYEGLPISILEAMRAGLPVVATAVGGVADCVLDRHNGFRVPHANVSALRAALASLEESPSLRADLGAAGRRLFEQRFTVHRMVSETASVYSSVTMQEMAMRVVPQRLELSKNIEATEALSVK
jgi:glycosyltransferase involved in cell wall biosynthesis